MRALLRLLKRRAETPLIQPPLWTPLCFDEAWYLSQYPGVTSGGLSAAQHYSEVGWRLGYDPCRYFWTKWYLDNNPDVTAADLNPLFHYEHYGAAEGRKPSPLFDPTWYASNYRISSPTNALFHYLKVGRESGYAPRADVAILEFKRAAGVAAFDSVAVEELDQKLSRVGSECFVEGTLRDGRSYLSEHGLNIAEHSLLDAIARDMRHRGVRCIAPYQAQFKDCVIFPGSTSILMNGHIINDEVAASADQTSTGQLKLWDRTWLRDGQVLIKYKYQPTIQIPKAIHLFKEHDRNYFHFCAELLPKLRVIERMGIDPEIPLLMCDDLDRTMYEAVDLLKHPARKVLKLRRDVPHRVNCLTYISDLALITDVYGAEPKPEHTFLPVDILNDIASALIGSVPMDAQSDRMLYLPRGRTRRRIVNEADLIEDLIPKRFEIVSMGDLSLKAQVSLFSSATSVVGGTGAAFTNMLWCRPGTRVVIMYPDHPYNNRTFWDVIAEARNLDIRYLVGERMHDVHGLYSMHDNYQIKPADLHRVLS